MSKRSGIILGLLFVVLVIEVIVFAPKELGISPDFDRPQAATRQSKDANASSQVMRDVHLIEAKADGKEWELWAEKAHGPKTNAEDWTIETVRVKFFASNGVTYDVTGKKGFVVPHKNDMKIEGNVVTKSSNGYVFKTESALYDSKSRRLVSPGEVEMIGPPDNEGGQLRLTGADMFAEFASNEISINRNVRARKKIRGERTVTLSSQRALFSGRSNMAHFFGNVVIDVDTMRVTGPEARFFYDPRTALMDGVEIDGGARVTDTNKFATSRAVNVNFKDDKVVFKGSPRVIQQGDELVGDEIVFLDGGRKVQVLNAKAQIDSQSLSQPLGQPLQRPLQESNEKGTKQ